MNSFTDDRRGMHDADIITLKSPRMGLFNYLEFSYVAAILAATTVLNITSVVCDVACSDASADLRFSRDVAVGDVNGDTFLDAVFANVITSYSSTIATNTPGYGVAALIDLSDRVNCPSVVAISFRSVYCRTVRRGAKLDLCSPIRARDLDSEALT